MIPTNPINYQLSTNSIYKFIQYFFKIIVWKKNARELADIRKILGLC